MIALLEKKDICKFCESLECSFMTWAKPQHTKNEVNRAGKVLTGEVFSLDIQSALKIVNNWRSSHAYPLHIVTKRLKIRIKNIGENALVSQRLKRLSSITSKLKRFDDMQFSRMQDIGGCRAVMDNVEAVYKLADLICEANVETPELIRQYDYIAEPKPDGYRGIHFAAKYQSKAEGNRIYDGMRVEIQIRSQLQHAWATSGEIVSAFTGQALKSDIGEERWKRFFSLMGSAIAIIEDSPTIPNTPSRKDELITEIRKHSKSLKILETLAGWGLAVKESAEVPNAKLFLLEQDTREGFVRITPFPQNYSRLASKQYLELEKKHANDDLVQVVLVTVDSLATLRRAYPNYFSDTADFAEIVEKVIAGNL